MLIEFAIVLTEMKNLFSFIIGDILQV